MYCPNCGAKSPDNANFCMNCGNTLRIEYYNNQAQPKVQKIMCCPNCRSNEIYPVQTPEYNFHTNQDFVMNNTTNKRFYKCLKCANIIIGLEDLTEEISEVEASISKHKKQDLFYILQLKPSR